MTFTNSFSNNIFLQKYSMNGTETWDQLCERVVKAVCGQHLPTELQEEIYQYMRDRKFIPGGRYLYSAGRAYHPVNNCLAGEEKIITKEGIKSLKELVGKSVEILNKEGKWEQGTIKMLGNQLLYNLHLSNGDSIRATANHRWWQADGSRVTTEEVTRIPFTTARFYELDAEGVRHGIVYGDGTVHKNHSHVLLIGENKQELADWWDSEEEKQVVGGFGSTLTFPVVRTVKTGKKIGLQPLYYKELPDASNCTPQYARGFIAGLIATDGSTKTSTITISCEGYETGKRIAELATLGGCIVTQVRVDSTINPSNGKERELTVIGIKPFSAPLIRKDQLADKPNTRPSKMWVDVVGKEELQLEPVYCVTQTNSESFTLANGLMTSNCYLFRAKDSREGWSDLMQKITSSLMSGGGIGVDYSALRPYGAKIQKTGGESTGPIALMEMVNEAGRHIMQGGQRRSAVWAGLTWDHQDIETFVNLKNWNKDLRTLKEKDYTFRLPMEGTNISIIYDTDFFVAIEDKSHPKHKQAKKIWNLNCKQAFSTAEPGMSFNFCKDAESLRNACVTGDTKLLTKQGLQRIDSLLDSSVEIWNGWEWSEVQPKITGYNQPMLKVSMSDGRVLKCTPYHKFHLSLNYKGEEVIKEAHELMLGDKLVKCSYPIIKEGKEAPLTDMYTQGFYSADGVKNRNIIWLYEPKYELEPHLNVKQIGSEYINGVGVKRKGFRTTFTTKNKEWVPLSYGVKERLAWLSGLLDGDGCELKEGGAQLASVSKPFLLKLQQLLTTLGVNSKVLKANEEGYRSLPTQKGGTKKYWCKSSYRICISASSIQDLISLGLECKRLVFNKTPNRDASRFTTITKVEEIGTEEVVYCFNEPKNHTGVFDGVITGQCTEVTSEDDSDKCNLGTVWMNHCSNKEDFERVCYVATIFLLCGGLYSDVPTNKIREVGLANNRIGLGLGGMHDWLMCRKQPYVVTEELHRWLNIYERQSDEAAYVWANKLNVAIPKGKRAIAPTGTIGILAETTTGIEPLFCKAYKRHYLKGTIWKYEYVIDGTVKRLLDKGIEEKYIKDAYDIGFKDRVKFQADVQNYVDMAISSTCNLPKWGSENNNEETLQKYSKILLKYAKRLRGFTVYPDESRGGQPLERVDIKEATQHEGKVYEIKHGECIGGVCGV